MEANQRPPLRRRGRPVTAPGPIGQVARAVGGMNELARLVHRNRRSLLKAAREGRWIEGREGEILRSLCRTHGIGFPPVPEVSRKEQSRLAKWEASPAARRQLQIPAIGPETRLPKGRGRPITTLRGPIGALARKIGGLHVLAGELRYTPRALAIAARNNRWIQDPAGKRLEGLCEYYGIPYMRT
jgi:hypothetical protein